MHQFYTFSLLTFLNTHNLSNKIAVFIIFINVVFRYRPFFVKTDPGQLDLDDSEIVAQGQLEVTCIEVTRLSTPPGVQNIYCTVCAGNFQSIFVVSFYFNIRFIRFCTMD